MMLTGGRRGGLLLALAAAVGVALLIFAALSQQPSPPSPPASGLGTLDPSPGATSGPPEPSGQGKAVQDGDRVQPAARVPLGPSRPVSISIPAIDVGSQVFPIGTAEDGTLAVPQPGPNLDKAAWFESSPTPGQPGPSIIEGHVATEQSGPSVFFELGNLRPGDEITVKREDGKVAVFTVQALRSFDKDTFPTKLVYGGDLGTPTLRLITCSDFDQASGHHEGNLVVFSELTDVRNA